MTYIQDAIDAVNAELPGLAPELARLYALLALTTGIITTLEDVHDARAIWCDRDRPDHRALVPWAELSPDVRDLDRPYAEAIRRAAARCAADRLDVPPLAAHQRLSPADRTRVGKLLRERYDNGETIAELARATGYPFGRVRGLLRDAGTELRARGGRRLRHNE